MCVVCMYHVCVVRCVWCVCVVCVVCLCCMCVVYVCCVCEVCVVCGICHACEYVCVQFSPGEGSPAAQADVTCLRRFYQKQFMEKRNGLFSSWSVNRMKSSSPVHPLYNTLKEQSWLKDPSQKFPNGLPWPSKSLDPGRFSGPPQLASPA